MNYHDKPGLNYSTLRKFDESPDHCLMEIGDKPYFVFGRAFEDLIQDKITGSNMFDKYVITELRNMPQKLMDVMGLDTVLKTDIADLRIFNKDGSLSKSHKNLHDWLDLVITNKLDATYLSIEDYDKIQRMTDNMLTCVYNGYQINELLIDAEWQKELFWTETITDKKAKIDCYLDHRIFDIKTTANLRKAVSDIRYRYWIQDVHYCEGSSFMDNPVVNMPFLFASKEEPYICQVIEISQESKIACKIAYDNLVNNYLNWNKQPVGYLPQKTIYM